ncbi:hypothetical protein DFJ73DRAFT_164069 [Zopfochytrium polystomum]|nr:hypothetical protein DFJ73DRAFT_164069 [Zopfochytrium polystomum]
MKRNRSFGVIEGLLKDLASKMIAASVTDADFVQSEKGTPSIKGSKFDMSMSMRALSHESRYLLSVLKAFRVPQSGLLALASVPGIQFQESRPYLVIYVLAHPLHFPKSSMHYSQTVQNLHYMDDSQLMKPSSATMFHIIGRTREVAERTSARKQPDRFVELQPLSPRRPFKTVRFCF